MSEAIRDMVAILLQTPPWTPDRMTATGPNFRAEPAKPARPSVERDPALKARVLTVLQRGPATGDAIAKALHRPQQEVSAKLSRLFRDRHVERVAECGFGGDWEEGAGV